MNSIKSKAVGIDDISIQMIKAVSPFAIKTITHLVNLSLLSGEFPSKWKTSIVHPLPKVTSPSELKHLRPISVLPAMSKILEKIVVIQFTSFMEDNALLPKLQSGFRKNHSTNTALLNLFSDLFDARDAHLCSTVVMLDYSQAFDSISHELMIEKMRHYGFDNTSLEWIKSYLMSRQQVTRLGIDTSAPIEKRRVVPQGSCLGPILFNLYSSDLPGCLQSCTVHQYADDCQLHLAFKPEAMQAAILAINGDLQRIVDWSSNNGLSLNPSKCSVLHVAPEQLVQDLDERGVRVEADGEVLTVSKTVKTLGVMLDDKLTLSDHVTYNIQKALGRLRGLYRFRSLLPEPAKLQLVQALILSIFQYCYPVYGNSISVEDTARIQRMQNTCIRFVYGLRRFDHVSLFRQEAKLLPMDAVCRMMTCCTVRKVLSLGIPQYLRDRLQFREEVNLRGTRQNRMLHFPRVTLELGRRSFSFFGPKSFNDLPEEIRNVASFLRFKSKLKEFIVNSQY